MSPFCCNTSQGYAHSPLCRISFYFSSHHFFSLLFVTTHLGFALSLCFLFVAAHFRGAFFFCFLFVAAHPRGAFSICFFSVVAHPRGAHTFPSTKSPFLFGHHSLSLSFLLQCIPGVCYLFISSLLQCILGVHYLSPLCQISFSLSMAIMLSLSLLFVAMHSKGAHALSLLPN